MTCQSLYARFSKVSFGDSVDNAQKIATSDFVRRFIDTRGKAMEDKQAQTKKQLLDAAIEIFHKKGFQKARVSDIVAEAGLAQGTFYLYFKSKEEIFLHICSEFTGLFSSVLIENNHIFEGDSIEIIRDNMQRYLQRLVTLFLSNTKMTRLVFWEGNGYGGQFNDIYEDIHIQFVEIIRQRLEKAMESGLFRFDDAETVAAILLGLFDRTLFHFTEVKKEVDAHALSCRITDFVIGGLVGERTVP